MRKISGNYILKNISIIDPNTFEINRTNIYIKNDYIDKVSNSLDISEGWQEVNCKGKFTLPGFINFISHYEDNKNNLNSYLKNGFTCLLSAENNYNSIKKSIKYSDKNKPNVPNIFASFLVNDDNFNKKGSVEEFVWNLVEKGYDYLEIDLNKIEKRFSLEIIEYFNKYNKTLCITLDDSTNYDEILKYNVSAFRINNVSSLSLPDLNIIKEKGVYLIFSFTDENINSDNFKLINDYQIPFLIKYDFENPFFYQNESDRKLIIKSLSYYGAKFIGKNQKQGFIKEGFLADLLIYSENPLETKGFNDSLESIIKNGLVAN